MAEIFDELKISLIADATKANQQVDKMDKKLVAFQKKSAKNATIRLNASIATLASQLDIARKNLRKFKKEGDKSAILKARLEIQGLQASTRKAKSLLRGVEKQANTTGRSFFKLGQIVKDGAKAFAVFVGVRAVFNFFRDSTRIALEFESAFAGVIKTVDGTKSQLADLRKELEKLSTRIPVTFQELSRIGELGGQLGVGRKDIAKFTEVIAKIAVTTNLTAEEASIAFARIANIMGDPISQVQQYADSVVDLGNNFATTEKEIVEFANRIAASGRVVGLTSANIFAIATAFTSVGIKAEAGGTAVQKALLKINNAVNDGGKKLDKFAKLTGKSAEEFADAWKKDAGGSFNEFVRGLARSGDNASRVLGDLVGSDIRLQRAFLSVAIAGDILEQSLNRSSKAQSEATALNEEAEKRFETMESRLTKVSGSFKILQDRIGQFLLKTFVPLLENLVILIGDLSDGTNQLGKFTIAVRALGVAMTLLGTRSIIALVSALATTASVALIAGAAIAGVTVKVFALSVAMNAIPAVLAFTVVVAGLTAALSGLQRVKTLQNEIGDKNRKEANDSIEASKKLEKEIKNLSLQRRVAEQIRSKNSKQELKDFDQVLRAKKEFAKAEQVLVEKSLLVDDQLNLKRGFFNKEETRRRARALDSTARALDIRAKKFRENGEAILANFTENQKKINKAAGLSAEDQARIEAEKQKKIDEANENRDFGADSAKNAEDNVKSLSQKVKDFIRETENVGKETEKLAKDMKGFYDDIADSIGKAEQKQKDLISELDKFVGKETSTFVTKTAERDLRLKEKEKDIRKDIAEEEIRSTDSFEDRIDKQDKLNNLNERLNSILSERNQIRKFVEDQQVGTEFEAAQERASKSEFERDRLNFQERINQKTEEVNAEIEKQKKIVEVQKRFQELLATSDTQELKKRRELFKLVGDDQIKNQEDLAIELEKLGFEGLDREQQIELLKQIERIKGLEVEQNLIRQQQDDILKIKNEFLKKGEDAFKESVNRQITDMQRLILAIQNAQLEQVKLNDLRQSGATNLAASQQTQNVNINQTISGPVDLEAANRNLISKIR